MSALCPVPSQIDPDALSDLIADAQAISLPSGSGVSLGSVAGPVPSPRPLVIPPTSVSLVEGYDDYGV
jgi:hypothetical protein